MNTARNTTRQALKFNFNLETEENVSYYILLYLYAKMPILTIS